MSTMYERCSEESNFGQKCPGQRKFILATAYGTLPVCRSHAERYAEWRAEELPKPMNKWFELTVTCRHDNYTLQIDNVNVLEEQCDTYRMFGDHYTLEINVCDFRGQKIRLYPF